MHFIEVLLVVVSPNLRERGKAAFLLIEDGGKLRLPSQDLGEDESSFEVAARLLDGLTGLRARVLGQGWVDLVPAPIVDAVDRTREVTDDMGTWDRRFIGIPYGAMLPGEVVELKRPTATWVTLDDAFARQDDFHMDHLQILQSVSLCV
jgi:hypothetical protein